MGLLAGQLRVLGANLAGGRVGGVSAVGVEDGWNDAIAVVDGFNPGVDVVGVLTFDIDELIWGFGAVQVFDQLYTERAPVSEEDGDVLSGFGGSCHYAAAFLS